MNEDSTSQESLPSWIWFYILTSIFYIPYYIYYLTTSIYSIWENANSQLLGPIWPILNAWINIGELFPLAVIFLGFITLLLPNIRASYISRKYNLKDKGDYGIESLSEIIAYIGQIAPSMLIKVNLVRTDQIAFIYPLGFRKTALAVFGGLIRLWKSDRKAAEAILLHEIGHYRQGDSLILGTGSFFGYLINNWLKFTFIFVLVPAALIPIAYMFSPGSNYGVIASIVSVILSIPSFIIIYSSELLSFMILPIIAIWCSEINADRYMVTHGNSIEHSIKIIESLSEDRSIFKNLLIDPTHPPKFIRRLLIRTTYNTGGLALSILLFPFGYIIRFILLEIWAIGSYLMDFLLDLQGLDIIITNTISNFAVYFGETMPMTWICMALVISIWPFIEDKWFYLFSSAIRCRSRANIKEYAISFCVTIILFISTYGMAKSI
jgi:Zn-dependent protease with chaperone function